MTGGKASRQKGDRCERAIVNLLQERGFAAERIPLSGSAGGSFAGDITVPLLGIDRRLECKSRADGFRRFYQWLSGNYALVLKADYQPPLVCLRLSDFVTLCESAEKGRTAP